MSPELPESGNPSSLSATAEQLEARVAALGSRLLDVSDDAAQAGSILRSVLLNDIESLVHQRSTPIR